MVASRMTPANSCRIWKFSPQLAIRCPIPGPRGVHLGDHHAGEVEDHRDAQGLQQDRHHAGHVDAPQDLPARGAVGARDQDVVGLHRLHRRRRAHEHDEGRGEGGIGDLLLEPDAEHQDEHRQEDRFRNAEHVEQDRLEDVAGVLVLRDQDADRGAERDRDHEGDQDLGRGDADGVVHLRPAEQLAQHRQHVAERRQQQRIDQSVTRQELPRGQYQRQQRQPREDDLRSAHGRIGVTPWSEPAGTW